MRPLRAVKALGQGGYEPTRVVALLCFVYRAQ